MAEEIPEEALEDLLYMYRVATLEAARRRRSVKAAIDKEEAAVRYWTRKYGETRKPKDAAALGLHEEKLDMLQARMDIYRTAGRYARTRDPEDLLKMRMAQARYYKEKVEVLEAVGKPEEAEKAKLEYLPPPEKYEEWEEAMGEIERIEEGIKSACERYKQAKITGVWLRISPMERFMRTRSMQSLFAERYDTAKEAAEVEKTLPEIVREYRERLGE